MRLPAYASTTVLAVVAAVLTGCGSETTAAEPSTTPAASSPVTTTEAGPARSPRGHIMKTVGQEAAIGYPDQPPVIAWTVTALTVDEPCTSEYSLPADGHFVSATIEAQTSAEYVDAKFGGFHPGNFWELVDADGITHSHPDSNAVYRCHEGDWPTDMTPSSRYRFRVTFDSPTPHGVLVYLPPDRPDGWEWSF